MTKMWYWELDRSERALVDHLDESMRTAKQDLRSELGRDPSDEELHDLAESISATADPVAKRIFMDLFNG